MVSWCFEYPIECIMLRLMFKLKFPKFIDIRTNTRKFQTTFIQVLYKNNKINMNILDY